MFSNQVFALILLLIAFNFFHVESKSAFCVHNVKCLRGSVWNSVKCVCVGLQQPDIKEALGQRILSSILSSFLYEKDFY